MLTMIEHHRIPDDCKKEPGDEEGGSKGAEGERPGHVNH